MLRSVVLLGIGAVAGSAAVWLFAERGPGPVPALSGSAAPPDTARQPGPESARPSVAAGRDPDAPAAGGLSAARVAAYERAAAIDEAAALEAGIRRLAGELVSSVRDLELAALLARYSEIDPAAAVDLARRLYLDTRQLAPLMADWASREPDAALAELALIEPAGRQRALALAVLAVIGNDAAGIERVAASLPPVDRPSFEIDAIVARAEHDPAAALQSVLAMEQALLPSLALPGIAAAAVANDPEAALAEANAIDDFDLGMSYATAVLEAWAGLDPEGVFAWLERADPSQIPEYAAGAFQRLAAIDAERMLGLVETLPPAVGRNAQRATLQALAEQNLPAALAHYQALAPGQGRELAAQVIAQAYGRQDPEGALAWAGSLDAAPQSVIAMVLQGVAATDPDRAIDLVIREIEQAGQPGANPRSLSSLSLMMSISSTLDGDVGRIADRLLALEGSMSRAILPSAIANWSRNDPEAALNWTLVNADNLDPQATVQLGQQLVQQDEALARSTLERLTPAQRAGWLEGIVGGLARSDVDAALELVGRYSGQPGYESAYASVTRAVAQFDPARAANMLSRIADPGAQPGAAFDVARQWAALDPAAAAQWAAELPDENVRQRAMQVIAQSWASRDPGEARRWLDGLASGPVRDSAVDSYLLASAATGAFDPQMLDAYSSDDARQRGVSRAIVQLGRSDPDEAERLLDTYITDEDLRRQTEENLARSRASGGSVLLNGGGLVVF